MPSQIELFKQMDLVLDQLITTAKTLHEGVKVNVGQKELEGLQERQNEILRELAGLDELIEVSPPGATKQELDKWRLRIHEKLNKFQLVNEEFFKRLDSHMRIIEHPKVEEPSSDLNTED